MHLRTYLAICAYACKHCYISVRIYTYIYYTYNWYFLNEFIYKNVHKNGKALLFLSHVRNHITKIYFQKLFKNLKIFVNKAIQQIPVIHYNYKYGVHAYNSCITYVHVYIYLANHMPLVLWSLLISF